MPLLMQLAFCQNLLATGGGGRHQFPDSVDTGPTGERTMVNVRLKSFVISVKAFAEARCANGELHVKKRSDC